ncbi:MAG TPA: ABC transporter permease [Roseiflexaceae bacterium]|jgi:spermidine/putrescine transport system permease protein|nr:ABC transporter permease [Roseiflexaceae bacterium]
MIEAQSQTQPQAAAPVRTTDRRRNWRTALLGTHSVLTFIFLYAPIFILVLFSFTKDSFGVRWTGFTLDWYVRLLDDSRLLGAALNTLEVAVISTVVSTIIGTLTALAMERYRFRGRTGFDALLYLPIVIPEIVMALALLAFFSFSLGIVEALTGQPMRFSLVTVTISHIAFSISFVVVVVRTSLKGFDQRLEEAAQDLGANEWQTFRHITLPLILPGIIGGALLAFTLSLDDFVISFFTTGPGVSLLPVEVYGQVKRAITPKINAISTVMLVLSMTLVFLSQFVQQRRQ